jgi:hypothetical protein
MPTNIRHRLARLALGVATGMLVPAAAFAQAAGGAFPIDGTFQSISNWVLIVAEFLNILTWFVFSFLVFLLDPTFIFDMGGDGSLVEALNQIWQLSRNLMNVAFAVGLVGAAIYTVVTANKEFVSAHLKTFVMAVVLVNFSWFIPRVVLDIANIATVTVYSIPGAIVNPAAECRYTSTKNKGCFDVQGPDADGFYSCACKAVANFIPFPSEDEAAAKLAADPDAWECHEPAYCIRYVKLDPSTSTKQGTVLNGLVVNHARLSQLAMITRTKLKNNFTDIILFVLRELIVIVIHVALFFPLLALLIALIIRIPVLWFTMAFMPFYFLSWVVPDEIPFLGELKNKTKGIWDMFLKAAFLPAAVAVPLSVGFIMANAGTRVNFAGLSGIPFNLIDGMGSFAQLLWVLMVLAILWSGTFAVLAMMMGDMPGAGIVQSIKDTGEQAGKFAAELPLSAVPIPGPAGNLLNLKDMLNPRAMRQGLHTPQGAAGVFGDAGQNKRSSSAAADNILKDTTDKTGDKVAKALKDFSDAGDVTKSDEFIKLREALVEAGAANATRDNVDSIVSDINTTVKTARGTGLLTVDQLKKFLGKVDEMRAKKAPPAGEAPPAA